MTKLNFRLTASEFEKLAGKYTATPIAKGVLTVDQIAEAVHDGNPAIKTATARLIIDSLIPAIVKWLRSRYSVRMPFGTLSNYITGSVPSMDSALGEDNSFSVYCDETKELRSAVEKFSLTNESAKEANIRIEKIEDATTHVEGVIKGVTSFIVTGKGLSARAQGESLKLITEDGDEAATCTLVGEEDDAPGQRITAKLATAVPAGKYKLRLITKGATNPLAEPVTLTKKVTVTAA